VAVGVGLHIVLELLSVTTLRPHDCLYHRDANELQPLRYSMTAPIASGWSVAGWGLHHWKAPPLHGARQQRSFDHVISAARIDCGKVSPASSLF